MMTRFPVPASEQVTLANWRTAPFSRWAFHHVREIVPSADIPHDPASVMALPQALQNLDLGDFLDATDTDGLLVLHRGRIAFEHYAHGLKAENPHILMSVTKSMLGLLAGILSARGVLDLERDVESVLPELASTGFRGATIRQLLDMRSGIAFEEDYLATSGPIVEYRKATGWNPLQPGETASDLRGFFGTLTGTDGPHGGIFRYISPNTDLLGWAIERAAGRRYVDLMSELLWKPLGAERSAYITVDRLGAPRVAGGMCVTLRDLARVGQLLVQDGARDGRQVVPTAWLDDIERNGDPKAWDAGAFVDYFGRRPMHYRSKWYVLRDEGPTLFGWGIHGQHLFVDRRRQIVVARLASQALPIDLPRMELMLRAVKRIREQLAG
jgi:CubicO group peptidase (beta-lactamase class C family)